MRVILEMTEAESRTVSVERHILVGQGQAAAQAVEQGAVAPAPAAAPLSEAPERAEPPAAAPPAALDGGGASPALLVALGAVPGDGEAELGAGADQEEAARQGGTSAGAAPDWLTQILSRSRD